MYCTNCGEANQEKTKFCYNCGSPVASQHPQGPATTPAPSHSKKGETSNPIHARSTKQPRLTRYFRIIGWIVLIALFLIASTIWGNETFLGAFGSATEILFAIALMAQLIALMLQGSRLSLMNKNIIALVLALDVYFVLPRSLSFILIVVGLLVFLILWIFHLVRPGRDTPLKYAKSPSKKLYYFCKNCEHYSRLQESYAPAKSAFALFAAMLSPLPATLYFHDTPCCLNCRNTKLKKVFLETPPKPLNEQRREEALRQIVW
mgnify:CR=1 FL=1